MGNSDPISLLRSLSKIISDGIDKIDQTCTESNLKFPSPDEPFTPASNVAHFDPKISRAVLEIVAAAYQVIGTTQSAPAVVFTAAMQVRSLLERDQLILMMLVCSFIFLQHFVLLSGQIRWRYYEKQAHR